MKRPLGARFAIALAWVGHGSAAAAMLGGLVYLVVWGLGGCAQ
jgi:hypothetical protein